MCEVTAALVQGLPLLEPLHYETLSKAWLLLKKVKLDQSSTKDKRLSSHPAPCWSSVAGRMGHSVTCRGSGRLPQESPYS